MKEGKLVHSTNSRRYAIDNPETGAEVVQGQVCEIFLGGNWVKGSVGHSGNLYVIEGTTQHAYSGYYFVADDGGICGLCANMTIRIPDEHPKAPVPLHKRENHHARSKTLTRNRYPRTSHLSTRPYERAHDKRYGATESGPRLGIGNVFLFLDEFSPVSDLFGLFDGDSCSKVAGNPSLFPTCTEI